MRTNIDIDEALMGEAMKAGPFQTKKEAVEAGLKLLARQAAYREILKWEGRLRWEGDEDADWTTPIAGRGAIAEPVPTDKAAGKPASSAKPAKTSKSHARR